MGVREIYIHKKGSCWYLENVTTEGQYLEVESLWEGIQDNSRIGQQCAGLCKQEDERICRDLCCSLGSLVNRS